MKKAKQVEIRGREVVVTDADIGENTYPINRNYLPTILDHIGDDETTAQRVLDILNEAEQPTPEQVETDEQLDAQIAAIEARRQRNKGHGKRATPDTARADAGAGAEKSPAPESVAKKKSKKAKKR